MEYNIDLERAQRMLEETRREVAESAGQDLSDPAAQARERSVQRAADRARKLRQEKAAQRARQQQVRAAKGSLQPAKRSKVPRRMKKTSVDDNITKPAMRRLARRAGIKRISQQTFASIRGLIQYFGEEVVRDAIVFMEHAGRKTVTAQDVVLALKRNTTIGTHLYGFS